MRFPKVFALLLIAWLSFRSSQAGAQVTVTTPTVIQDVGAQKIDKLLIVPDDFKPVIQRIALVKVTTKVAKPTITVTDEKRSTVPYEKLTLTETSDEGTTHYYVVTRKGHTWFAVFGVDFENKAFINETIDFVVEGKVPQPDNPDTPDVPTPDNLPKDFDGIAGKVAQWSTGLKANTKIGSVYLKYSKLLTSGEGVRYTTEDVATMLAAELKALPEYADYQKFAQLLQADLARQWNSGFTKGVFSDFLKCVALGLGAK